MQKIKKLLPFLYVGVILKSKESITNCLHGQMTSERKHSQKFSYLKEESVIGSNLILNGNDSVREGEDTTGDALGLLLHQLFLLLVLLLQGSQSSCLFLLQKLPQLLKLLFDLLFCGLSLVLAHKEISFNKEKHCMYNDVADTDL